MFELDILQTQRLGRLWGVRRAVEGYKGWECPFLVFINCLWGCGVIYFQRSLVYHNSEII